jgi:thymidylate synthase (FAD)
MKLIKASYEILHGVNVELLKDIEKAGRTCYKSEDKIEQDSARKFVRMIINNGHESVLEHRIISVKFICDRGVSHEIVRHRLASFSQESTRYCNYSTGKFGKELTIIIPNWLPELTNDSTDDEKELTAIWWDTMRNIEMAYNQLIFKGWQPQQARAVLPNSLKTEIVVTANLRQWRIMLKQRTSPKAHPQMRELMCPLLRELQTLIPVIFDDIDFVD